MILLLALDLAVISKAQNLLTVEGLKEMETMAKEKVPILSNSEKIGMLSETLQVVAQYLVMPNSSLKQAERNGGSIL